MNDINYPNQATRPNTTTHNVHFATQQNRGEQANANHKPICQVIATPDEKIITP